jgi:hypothetical protein
MKNNASNVVSLREENKKLKKELSSLTRENERNRNTPADVDIMLFAR